MKIEIRNTVVTAGLAVAIGTSTVATAGFQNGYVGGMTLQANGDARVYVSGEGWERPECITQEDSWIILAEDASMREMAMQVGFDNHNVEFAGTGKCKGGREIVKSVTRINGE
jgi:hypothetical protein